mmetsp:Transcript_44899/g.104917  ORF Transcript_44899/g.104917 Transcript_44899/m.104917 type:complete len:275 (+) Transcript_44899:387-1211(+)
MPMLVAGAHGVLRVGRVALGSGVVWCRGQVLGFLHRCLSLDVGLLGMPAEKCIVTILWNQGSCQPAFAGRRRPTPSPSFPALMDDHLHWVVHITSDILVILIGICLLSKSARRIPRAIRRVAVVLRVFIPTSLLLACFSCSPGRRITEPQSSLPHSLAQQGQILMHKADSLAHLLLEVHCQCHSSICDQLPGFKAGLGDEAPANVRKRGHWAAIDTLHDHSGAHNLFATEPGRTRCDSDARVKSVLLQIESPQSFPAKLGNPRVNVVQRELDHC